MLAHHHHSSDNSVLGLEKSTSPSYTERAVPTLLGIYCLPAYPRCPCRLVVDGFCSVDIHALMMRQFSTDKREEGIKRVGRLEEGAPRQPGLKVRTLREESYIKIGIREHIRVSDLQSVWRARFLTLSCSPVAVFLGYFLCNVFPRPGILRALENCVTTAVAGPAA